MSTELTQAQVEAIQAQVASVCKYCDTISFSVDSHVLREVIVILDEVQWKLEKLIKEKK